MKARAAMHSAPVGYPPGHFTQPVRAWFGPMWQSAIDWSAPTSNTSATSTATRERGLAEGKAWAIGTVPMTNTPKISGAPKWMKKRGGGSK